MSKRQRRNEGKMNNIDLHIHSKYSDDGEYTVREIMELGKQADIKYLSITDHNSVRALGEAFELSDEYGIKVISGVELDCTHQNKNLHLLGYNFDYTYPEFLKIEENIERQERAAADKKIELIRGELGIEIDSKEIIEASGGGIVTGELIAEVLLTTKDSNELKALLPYLEGGDRADNPYVNFYWDYFSQGKAAYVPIEYITLSEAVDLIHRAGGKAVLAHPGQNLKDGFEFINAIIKTGIDGIEVYSSYHSRIDTEYFNKAAQANRLLVTCGSDFHGKTKPSIRLCGHRAGESTDKIVKDLKNAGVL